MAKALTQEELEKSRSRLSAGRIRAIEKAPYFATALLSLETKEIEGFGTFAVDQRWIMYYDPAKCLEWSVNEIATVWLHEIGHVIRNHGARFKATNDPSSYSEYFNAAADAAINYDLREMGLVLPNPEVRYYAESNPQYPTWKTGMTTEEMYAIAKGHGKKQEEEKGKGSNDSEDEGESEDSDSPDEQDEASNDKSDSDDRDSEESDDDSENSEDSDSDDSEAESNDSTNDTDELDEDSDDQDGDDSSSDDTVGDSESDPQQSGETSESSDSPSDEPNDDSESDDSNASPSEDASGSPTSPSGEPEDGDSSTSPPKEGNCGSGAHSIPQDYELDDGTGLDPITAEQLRKETAKEIENYNERYGNVPGGLLRDARKILDPKIDWVEEFLAVIRKEVATIVGQSDYSYARPSRRSAQSQFIFPSMRDAPPPEIVIILDTSGSMDTNKEIAQALGEMEEIVERTARHSQLRGVRIINCDAGANEAVLVSDMNDFEIIGGGGTDMRVGIKAASELLPAAGIIIILTDGGTPWPREIPEDNEEALYIALIIDSTKGSANSQKRGWSTTGIPDWIHVIEVNTND